MALTGAMWRGYDIYYPFSTGFWGVLTIVMGFFTYRAIKRLASDNL